MQNSLQGLLAAAAAIIGRLNPVAKAVVAAVLPLASALVNMALAGSVNLPAVISLATAALTALAVYLVPNRAAKPAPAPVPAPPAK